MLCDSVYIEFQEKQTSAEGQKADQWLLGDEEGARKG